jgi:hypothetical protein
MVTSSLKQLFEKEGMGLIPLEQGARLVLEEIEAPAQRPVELVVSARSHATPTVREPLADSRSNPTQTNGKLEPVFQRSIDLDSLPVLRSHVIDGHAVLPMALILEWLAEGALHRHPGFAIQGMYNLRLLKGVVLRDHKPATVSIRVGKVEHHGAEQRVHVEMVGVQAGGRELAHARGEVVISAHHSPGQRLLPQTNMLPLKADREEIYRRLLFHGPAMQAIHWVEGCTDRAISAFVSTSPPPSTWIEKPLRQFWLTDPLAIDGAFQLLVLWSQERFGASSLPTAVGGYRQYRRSFPSEGVRVLVAVRQCSKHRAVADIEFVDSEGSPVARIESYECVIDSSLNQAFRRNRLPHCEVTRVD